MERLRSRFAAVAVLLVLGCVADIARAGLHQRAPTSYAPLPRASAATRRARSARSTESHSSDLDVVTTASGEFVSGLAKVEPMDACFVDTTSPPPADPKNGRRKTFGRHLCQVTPLNHSFETFVTRCDSDHIADLQDKREDFQARVGAVSVAVDVDGPKVISYVPRFGQQQSRKRRDVSGTQHCIQRRNTPGVTPPRNSCMTRNVLMLQVDFTDSVGACDLACIRATMWLPQGASNRQAANEAFKASSYGQTEYDEATSDVIRVTINENVGDNYASSCGTDSLANKAEALATTAGFRISDYHHTIFYIPSDFGGGACEWGGLAQSPGSRVWMRVAYGRWYFLEHELGHNLGLGHAGTDADDDSTNEATYGDNMGVMGDGWTFNGPSRMSNGWIVDGHGLVRLRAVDIDTRCRRMRISAMDYPPTNSTHTNPHGDTMVTVPRSSEDDRYFVTFYALRDLYGTTLRHETWRNQVHIQGYNVASGGTTKHVAKLSSGQSWTATGTIAGDVTFTVLSIGTDTAEVEIRHGDQQSCAGSNSPTNSHSPTLPPTQPPTFPPTAPLPLITCGQTVRGTTVGGSNVLHNDNNNAANDVLYSFTLSQNRIITFDGCQSAYDTYLRILSEDLRTEISFNDDHSGRCSASSSSSPSHIASRSYAAGNYVLVIEGYGNRNGEFAVDMQCAAGEPTASAPPTPPTNPPTTSAPATAAPSPSMPTIICGQTITDTTVGGTNTVGSDAVGSDANDALYALTLTQDTTITFNGCQSQYDSYVSIRSQDLTQIIAQRDDGCPTTGSAHAYASLVPSQVYPAGVYVLVVSGYQNSNGAFSVHVQCVTETPTAGPTTPAPNPLPTPSPTLGPTAVPSTSDPTISPTASPTTSDPTKSPTVSPISSGPSTSPTTTPTMSAPSSGPTNSPASSVPTPLPTSGPTSAPSSKSPTDAFETFSPTAPPTTLMPTPLPSPIPPTSEPTLSPTLAPTTFGVRPAPTLNPTTTPPVNSATSTPTAAPGSVTSSAEGKGDGDEETGAMSLAVIITIVLVAVLLAVAVAVYIRRSRRHPAAATKPQTRHQFVFGEASYGVKNCEYAPNGTTNEEIIVNGFVIPFDARSAINPAYVPGPGSMQFDNPTYEHPV